MSAYLNVGSFFLGLVSWMIPVISISFLKKGKGINAFLNSIFSFCAGVVALCLQFFEVLNRITLQDFSALMDTGMSIAASAVILSVVMVILNVVMFCIENKSINK